MNVRGEWKKNLVDPGVMILRERDLGERRVCLWVAATIVVIHVGYTYICLCVYSDGIATAKPRW